MPLPRRRRPQEVDLVAGLRARDEGAIRRLHGEYGSALLGFLLRTLGDRAAAEDVLQQVFLEAWQRGPEFDPARGSMLTWLFTIARSRAIDHQRRRVPEPRDPTGALALLEGPRDGGLAEAEADWRFAWLLSRLPEAEADVLRRRFARGQTQAEIARETGLPLGTVKLRMVDGLRRLRELLDAEEEVA